MHLIDLIEDVESKIVSYYKNNDNKRYGWTVLQNLKTKVDYIVGDNAEENIWSKEYYKLLSEKADELKIKRKLK